MLKPARQRTAITLLLAAAMLLHAQPSATEYQIKAAYLLNFAKFVTWPSSAAAPRNEFKVCIAGDDPFGPVLDATLRGESIEGRRVVAQRVANEQIAGECDVLFLSRSAEGQARRILAGLKGSSVLTVSDMPGFIERGGMIQFVTQADRVRFRVNLDAAEDAGLTLSSELLKVASEVRTRRAGKGR